MQPSHLQTRALLDALKRVDSVLRRRGTRLRDSAERRDLAECFASRPYPQFFHSWAFSRSDYVEALKEIEQAAPDLAGRIPVPENDRDFTVVGCCSLRLRFGDRLATSFRHVLTDGRVVRGAKIRPSGGSVFSNGLVAARTSTGESVYLAQAELPSDSSAAKLAASLFAARGPIQHSVQSLLFPEAETSNLTRHDWVRCLKSEDGLYSVTNHVSYGKALIDRNGFLAEEIHVVRKKRASKIDEVRQEVIIDGPFVAFFADDDGVHAAAWFNQDSFFDHV